jgi:hypothetical protein
MLGGRPGVLLFEFPLFRDLRCIVDLEAQIAVTNQRVLRQLIVMMKSGHTEYQFRYSENRSTQPLIIGTRTRDLLKKFATYFAKEPR